MFKTPIGTTMHLHVDVVCYDYSISKHSMITKQHDKKLGEIYQIYAPITLFVLTYAFDQQVIFVVKFHISLYPS